jgi:hypothetical protein
MAVAFLPTAVLVLVMNHAALSKGPSLLFAVGRTLADRHLHFEGVGLQFPRERFVPFLFPATAFPVRTIPTPGVRLCCLSRQ